MSVLQLTEHQAEALAQALASHEVNTIRLRQERPYGALEVTIWAPMRVGQTRETVLTFDSHGIALSIAGSRGAKP